MRFSFPPLPPLAALATIKRRIVPALARLKSRASAFIPALAPAEKAALLVTLAVLASGGLLRAWERAGMRIGPVDDWESLRALIVRSRDDFARSSAGGDAAKGAGAPVCDVGSGEATGNTDNLVTAGFAPFKKGGKASDGKKTPPARPLDLNAAGEKALLSLPGVGPSTAKAILAWRAAQGRFRAVDDLMQVKGIGPKKMEALRPYLRVNLVADSTPPP